MVNTLQWAVLTALLTARCREHTALLRWPPQHGASSRGRQEPQQSPQAHWALETTGSKVLEDEWESR